MNGPTLRPRGLTPRGPALSRAARWALPGAALAGTLSGACLGLPGGWIGVQLALVLLLGGLHAVAGTAARAGVLLAAFEVGLMGAGHAGFLLGVPPAWRGLAGVPLAVLVTANAACAGLAGALAWRWALRPALRLGLVLPSLWTLQEWLFSLSELAVPWIRLGHAQAPDGPLAGMLPVGGVLLASWSMVALAGAIVCALASTRWQTRLRWAGLVAAGLGASAALHHVQWTVPAGSLNVLLVQAGSDSAARSEASALPALLRRYREVLAASSADLVVTGQLALPKTPQALPPGYLAGLRAALEGRHADAWLGLYLPDPDGPGLFNGIVSLGVSGLQHYRKHQLFPFGEFLPFGGAVQRWLRAHAPYAVQETARPRTAGQALLVQSHRLSPAICFEAAFGDDWRRRAAAADMLVNVSSDSAIRSAQLRRQFTQIVQARALELQKPALRTSDIGASFVLDARGHVVAQPGHAGFALVQQAVQGRQGLTPYGRHGDSLALLLAGLCLCAAGLGTARRRRAAPTGPAAPPPSSAGPAPACGRRWRRRRLGAQAGQVLPAALMLLLVTAAAVYLMVNTGQAVVEKIRATNAADAAAYSVGVLEARALNYDAYINRAIVANEIAVAQMVSFTSWAKYFATAADEFGGSVGEVLDYLGPNPKVFYLEVLFGGTEYVARYYGGGRSANEFVDEYLLPVVRAAVVAHGLVIYALQESQAAMHAVLVFGGRQASLARDIVRAMDPGLHAKIVSTTHGFDAFTRRYAKRGAHGKDERGRLADVTMRSRDDFTRERNWTLGPVLSRPDLKNEALKKRGGTDLIGYDEWRAVDTLELHGQRWGCGKLGVSWCADVRRPIGWGAARAGSGSGSGYHGNAYGENSRTANKAEGDIVVVTPGFIGIPDSQGLADLDASAALATGVSVQVWKAQRDLLTAGNAAQAAPAGRLALFSAAPAGGRVAALARAEVFFDRIAARADGKTEIASLYGPYWRVRLVAPLEADRADVARDQDKLSLP